MPRTSTAPNADLRQRRNTKSTIGKRIAQRRAVLGMSQTELAHRFGASVSTIAQAERGEADLHAGDMVYLAEILKTPVGFLLSDEFASDEHGQQEDIIALSTLGDARDHLIEILEMFDRMERLLERRSVMDALFTSPRLPADAVVTYPAPPDGQSIPTGDPVTEPPMFDPRNFR